MNEPVTMQGDVEPPANTSGNQPDIPKRKKGGAEAAAIFWERFPTPEARSQYMKERFAKAKAERERKALSASRPAAMSTARIDADEEQAADAICGLRILLGDVLAVLDACDVGAKARHPAAPHRYRKCILAANSLLQRGINHLDVAGMDVGQA